MGIRQQWTNLEGRAVWDWSTLAEWDDVSNAAIAKGEEAHLGFFSGLMIKKGTEFPIGDPRRDFKYRVVFRGNDVEAQNGDVAIFPEPAMPQTTLGKSRNNDLLACFPGNSVDGQR